MATTRTRRNRQKPIARSLVRFGPGRYKTAGHVLCSLAFPLVPACDTADGPPTPAASSGPLPDAALVDMAAFSDAFEVVRTLTLEESDQAMVVQPMVTVGGNGQFFLAEPMEGQVNVYGTDGQLQSVVGRMGEGPGEFVFPITAQSTLDGGIVVADLQLGRLTFIPPGGDGVPEVERSPISQVLSVQDLGGSRYLLGATDPSERVPRLLHIWNRESGEMERSFLPIGVPEEIRDYAASFTAVSATLEGDTIWAVWALSDTLYKFDAQGERLGVLPLPLPRPMGTLIPGDGVGDPAAFQAASDALTQLFGVSILGNGELVVQSMQTRGSDAVWDLLIMDRQGRLLWRAANMPRLLALHQDLFYFDDPASVLPNRWLVARRKGGQ